MKAIRSGRAVIAALLFFVVAISLLIAVNVRAGEATVVSKEIAPPAPTTEPDRWHFVIAMPGLLAGLTGTVGLDGNDADVDLGFDEIFNHLDMVFAARTAV